MIPTKWSKKFSLFFKSLHEKRRMLRLRLRRIVLVRQPKTISESGTLLLLLQRTLRLSLRRPPLLRRQRRRRRPRRRRQLSSKNGRRRTNRLILPSDFFGNRLRAGMKMSSTALNVSTTTTTLQTLTTLMTSTTSTTSTLTMTHRLLKQQKRTFIIGAKKFILQNESALD